MSKRAVEVQSGTAFQCGASQRNGAACPNPARWTVADNPFCLRCGVHANHPSGKVQWVPLRVRP